MLGWRRLVNLVGSLRWLAGSKVLDASLAGFGELSGFAAMAGRGW